VRTFDDNAANAGLLALFLDEVLDFKVFEKKITVGCPRCG